MKVVAIVATVAVGAQAISIRKGAPGAIGGGAGSIESSGGYAAATSSSAGSSASGLMGALKGLIGEVQSANAAGSTSYGAGEGTSYGSSVAGSMGGSGAGSSGGSVAGGAAGGSAGFGAMDSSDAQAAQAAAAAAASGMLPPATSGTDGEASSRGKFVQGQMMHFGAANPMEHSDELEAETAIRSAMSTPSSVGHMPKMSEELSTAYPTSYLKLNPESLLAGSMLSPSDTAAIGASIEKETEHFKIRASGCGACPTGVNYGSCPAGFTEARSGECTPSPSYSGFCNRPVDITTFSEVQKDELEMVCDTCFKCN